MSLWSWRYVASVNQALDSSKKNTVEKIRISLTWCFRVSLLSESYQLESVLILSMFILTFLVAETRDYLNLDCLKTSFIEDDTETTSCYIRTEEENPGTYRFQNLCTKSDERCQGIVSRGWSLSQSWWTWRHNQRKLNQLINLSLIHIWRCRRS